MVDENVENKTPSDRGQDARDTGASIPPVTKKRFIRSRRQIFMQILAAAVILICGIIIGFGGALQHFKPNIVPNRVPPPKDVVDDMRARYDLTDEQAEKISIAIRDSWERMRTIFQENREKMDAEFKNLSADMKQILTGEQFRKWEDDIKARRRRRPGRFGPRRPGRRGGPGPGEHDPGGWKGKRRSGGRYGRPGPGPNGVPGPNRPDHREFRPGAPGPKEPNATEK